MCFLAPARKQPSQMVWGENTLELCPHAHGEGDIEDAAHPERVSAGAAQVQVSQEAQGVLVLSPKKAFVLFYILCVWHHHPAGSSLQMGDGVVKSVNPP